jgi:hypothetical protein
MIIFPPLEYTPVPPEPTFVRELAPKLTLCP